MAMIVHLTYQTKHCEKAFIPEDEHKRGVSNWAVAASSCRVDVQLALGVPGRSTRNSQKNAQVE